jgi:predicted carbohydrate-binding protein with CBM5 and CBM33 domain
VRRRNLRPILTMLSAVAVAAATIVAPTGADAHGVAIIPGSRTYLCYIDGLRSNGQIIAYNPACADAIAQGGQQPLYDWFGVLRSDAGGRTVGYIPDGQICGGGTTKYAAYNAARTDWPLTHLTAGSSISVHYSNWAAHPGTFHVYVTKDGWSPTTPLAWSDLESFWSAADPPQSGPPGAFNYYSWDMALPAGKTGRHMIFMQWVRSDSQENFFSCSDVVFDGGNGEVTGVGPGGTTSPTPSQSVSPTPSQSVSPTPSQSPSPSPSSAGACTATWQDMPTNWPGHFQAQVTVRNPGTASVNGWTVHWSYQAGQGFEGAPWNGTLVQPAPNAAVSNVDWNRVLPPNGTTSFGFNGTGTAPGPAPTLTCTSP